MKNTDKTATKERRRTPVTVIVEREFIGTKSISEAFIPIIFDDIRKAAEKTHTLDSGQNSA